MRHNHLDMIHYTLKKDHQIAIKNEGLGFYHERFALAILNYELNRQEERLGQLKNLKVKS